MPLWAVPLPEPPAPPPDPDAERAPAAEPEDDGSRRPGRPTAPDLTLPGFGAGRPGTRPPSEDAECILSPIYAPARASDAELGAGLSTSGADIIGFHSDCSHLSTVAPSRRPSRP